MSKPEQQDSGRKSVRWNRYSAYLYLAMALLIVGVATASIFALNRSIGSLPEYSTPEYSIPTGNKNDVSHDVFIPLLPPDNSPVFGEESGITDESSAAPSGTGEPLFVCPVDSTEIVKACALDKLVFSATMKDYRVHTGLDIAAPVGASVRCYTAGVVESIKEDAFYGKIVTVRHQYGLLTSYANLAPELSSGITVGSELKTGDIIGFVGTTAMVEASDPSHLHFEMKLNNAYIDPAPELFE